MNNIYDKQNGTRYESNQKQNKISSLKQYYISKISLDKQTQHENRV